MLNSLTKLLFDQSKYGEVETLCRYALTIKEELNGPNHPNLVTMLNKLARSLQKQSKYDEAESLLRRALKIVQATHESDHPNVASTIGNLASLLDDQGKCGEAQFLRLLLFARPAKKKEKKNSNFHGRVCGNCSAREGSACAPELLACARCGLVEYCSRDCQKAHWKATHKQHCTAKADRAPQHQKETSEVSMTQKGGSQSAKSGRRRKK